MTERISGLDWVFLVVLHHSGIPILFFRDNGWLGMDILFALSSYLLTSTVINHPELSLKTILFKRVLTIWPLCIFYLLIIGHFDQTWPYMLFMGNWWVIKHGWSDFNLIGHMWALSLIEQFYFIWAVVLSRVKRDHLIKVIFAGLIISFIARIFLYTPGNFYPVYMNTFARLDPFLLGALLAIKPVNISKWFSRIVIIIGISVLIFINIRTGNLFTVLTGYFLIALISLAVLNLGLKISNHYSETISTISKWGFGIFVWHKLVIEFVSGISDCVFIQTPLVIAGTLVLSVLSYKFVQSPFLKLKPSKQN
jgi:peptidoglycan/LPS O-acetylase OafA/YrhL